MTLTKFKLVNTKGLKGITYKGDFLPFEQLDDTLAEQLIGKTHVLERIEEPTPAVAVAQLAPASEPAPAEEAPATGRKRPSN